MTSLHLKSPGLVSALSKNHQNKHAGLENDQADLAVIGLALHALKLRESTMPGLFLALSAPIVFFLHASVYVCWD